jgi:hypothetical protein
MFLGLLIFFHGNFDFVFWSSCPVLPPRLPSDHGLLASLIADIWYLSCYFCQIGTFENIQMCRRKDYFTWWIRKFRFLKLFTVYLFNDHNLRIFTIGWHRRPGWKGSLFCAIRLCPCQFKLLETLWRDNSVNALIRYLISLKLSLLGPASIGQFCR